MAEELDQTAITNMFRAANAAKDQAAAAEAAAAPTPINFGKRVSISPEQMQMFVSINQVFAQGLGDNLSARLGTPVNISMLAVERSLYHSLLDSINLEASFLAQSRFRVPDARALLCIDLDLVEPLVNLALGGLADIPKTNGARELTQIDIAIMEILFGILCTEMNLMWAPFGLQSTYESTIIPVHVKRLYPKAEYVLSFTYEIAIGDRHGSLQVILPTVVASTFLRELDRRDNDRTQPAATRNLLQDRLGDLGVRTTLRLPPFKVMASQIINLSPETLLESNLPTTTACLLGMEEGPAWEAMPMLSEGRIAAKLLRPHMPSLPKR